MTECVVFTHSSLRQFSIYVDEWLERNEIPADGSWGVLGATEDGYLFVLDATSRESDPLVLIVPGARSFRKLTSGRGQALSRLHRVANLAVQRNLTLPPAWGPFQDGNKLVFFAYHFYAGRNYRFVAEIAHRTEDVIDVMATVVTDDDPPLDLRTFEFDHRVYEEARRRLPQAVRAIQQFAAEPQPAQELQAAYGVVDLEAVSFGAVVGGRTRRDWLPALTKDQRDFVKRKPTRSLKLRGPAGTGKTLAMELKVLYELDRARYNGREVKILFVTHSWAVAEQVRGALDLLDDEGLASEADVLPLLTLADYGIHRSPSVRLLGEDSFSGKRAQLDLISQVLEESVRRDWLAYLSGCSQEFQARVESEPRSTTFNALVWDLMLEFGCVIGANGILPGIGAREKYLKVDRRPWMLPLRGRPEMEFVFRVYERYINELLARGTITTDQVINDYLNYLSTYTWHAKRRELGWDLIFVDELHLFNQQERMVFHRLTRNPEAYPILFMALDPRQAPAETYVDFPLDDVTWGEGLTAEATFGTPEDVDLNEIFRFTEQILRLLRHLDACYPALQLGDDWGVSVAGVSKAAGPGAVPTLVMHSSPAAEAKAAILEAVGLAESGPTAVLCLSAESFEQYKEFIASSASGLRGRFRVIESRDDVITLRYSRRSIVLSQPHYVAGLQFDHVVLGGCRASFVEYSPYQDYSLRRFLSDMYLGISRARKLVVIHGGGGRGNLPQVIRSALDASVLSFRDG